MHVPRGVLTIVVLLGVLAGCATRDYKDNAAEIARDPRCMSKPSIPDAEPAPWCTPRVDSRTKAPTTAEVDFTGKGKPD